MPRATNKFKRCLYQQCSNVFIKVRIICFKCNLRMGGESSFKVGGTSARQTNRKFLWFKLATVTSQALKIDVIIVW